MKRGRRSGFSLVEAIIVVVFIGVMAAIAMPRLDFGAIGRQKADNAARKLAADLRRVRRLAISAAAVNTAGFSLNMFGSSPYGYHIRNVDGGALVESHSFDLEVSCGGGSTFEFGPLGNLSDSSDTSLTVSGEGKVFTITIVRATGAVKCVEN